MVVIGRTEDIGTSFQKGFTEWWSEESEYILQRIERWTIIARGYNRLRTERSTRAHTTSHDLQDSRWPVNVNTLNRCHRRPGTPEETRRINCCGTFNYQSNNRIDSTCLETYRYDHSIYFKTIGDIRSSKSKESNLQDYCNNDNLDLNLKVLAKSPSFNTNNEHNHYPSVVAANGDVRWDYLDQDQDDPELDQIFRNAWPIVDLAKLEIESNQTADDQLNNNNNNNSVLNNNVSPNSGQAFTRSLSYGKSRRSSKTVRQPMIHGENNVAWPGVLLSYKNMDPALSSSQRAVNVK